MKTDRNTTVEVKQPEVTTVSLVSASAANPLLEEDPITGLKWRTVNWQTFSWGWVGLSLVAFVLAQAVLAEVRTRTATIHGALLMEALLNVATYYGGGLLIGIVSPKIRIAEPAVAALLSIVLVMTVGMWMPFGFLSFSLLKTLLLGGLVFCLAWTGAVHGEKITRQL